MSFFPAPPPPPDAKMRAERERPEWMGPPPRVLPGVSPQRAVVFKTDRAFLMAHRFHAYPSGVEFTLTLRLRDPDDYRRDVPWGAWDLHGRRTGPLPDDFLRLGVLLSDGSRWTNLDPLRRVERPTPPVVWSLGGQSEGDAFAMRHWIWPLPPDGALTIVAEWPAFDIGESRVDVDATELRALAADATPLW